MVEIREALTKKEQKRFLDFPLKLYKNNEYFVPPLYMDEKKLFRKDYGYYDTCKAVYYNAYKDGKMVGRIAGIIQGASNEIRNEKRVRFTRFDSIDDQEVAQALFDKVEGWAKENGMDTICGPLGFSDLEREGLLIEGFDQDQTFEEQYNYEYYRRLIENCGYEKEIDWTESKLYLPDEGLEEYNKISDFIMKRYNLHLAPEKDIKSFIKNHKEDFFYILDESYKKLYGVVPFTENMKNMLMENFDLIIKREYVEVVLDENNKGVAFGIMFPGIGKALQKSGGRLTPACLIKLLKTLKHPKVLDLGLIGVLPEWENRGVSSIICSVFGNTFKQKGADHCETNLNLEDNYSIKNQWKRFKEVENKRRRSFVKKI